MQDQSCVKPIYSEVVPDLFSEHFRHLATGSGISTGVIKERGYRSITAKPDLEKLGFITSQQRVPGILIPLWSVDGQEAGYQFRPDHPRNGSRGRLVKYENPKGSSNRIDCPPRCREMLGNPHVPLWITEGSKKADALASNGACAVSVSGVWGFKGKNQFGGITFLADWDYVAVRNRTVYLAFDSDIVSKDPVRKALEHLAEHLKRKGALIKIIQLPQLEGQDKTGIDDYLLRFNLEDAERLAGDFKPEEPEDKERYVSGFVLSDGTVGEMVTSNDERCFVIGFNGKVRKAYQHDTGKVTYLPTRDGLVGEVVHFAPTAIPYESQSALFKEIKAFVHRYLELPADFEEIASLYVLLTWVYEFAPSIPYLRVIGDWGTGKTRFLQVVGAVCFRSIFASGATTPAPIFRILEQFRGTLVLDEADFKDSSAWMEMVKLLNNGYRPGMPVLRADKENGKWYPKSYQVFGPKLISTRFRFKDEALESRCLTSEMMPLTRDDIPRILPPSFETEVNDLRSKLLTFRLINLIRLKGKTFGNELLEPNLQPRLQEILIPLKAMLNGDGAMVESLGIFIHRLQESLFTRRRESYDGRVLATIIELHEEGIELTSQNIAEKINEDDEEVTDLSADKVGRITKKLGFIKERVGKERTRILRWDEERISKLVTLYGLKTLSPLSLGKAVNVSLVSAIDSKEADTIKPGLSKCPPKCPPESEAGSGVEADTKDGADTFLDKEGNSHYLPGTDITIDEAISMWKMRGKPVIHLGPGENCFDLEKLLNNGRINERHLEAVRKWLKERTQ
ncbi:MAG: DUF3854 domain-containing protein [Dehalococcoidales bacterium]|nr:DUF3854 domain-containing protein [Dehalococcoidales bacterium]